MELRFGVLGPVEVTVDGRAVDLGRPKQRAVLAALLLRAGEVVPVDRLVDDLWDGRPPVAAVGSLHAYVANLRRILEPGRPARAQPTVLLTRGAGYLPRVTHLDATAFTLLAERAQRALAAGRPGGRRGGRGRGRGAGAVARSCLLRPRRARFRRRRGDSARRAAPDGPGGRGARRAGPRPARRGGARPRTAGCRSAAARGAARAAHARPLPLRAAGRRAGPRRGNPPAARRRAGRRPGPRTAPAAHRDPAPGPGAGLATGRPPGAPSHMRPPPSPQDRGRRAA
jgi:hypothetical protein